MNHKGDLELCLQISSLFAQISADSASNYKKMNQFISKKIIKLLLIPWNNILHVEIYKYVWLYYERRI